MSVKKPPEERFWSRVDRRDKGDCWNYLGALQNGYGVFWLNGKNVKAHRYSYELAHGPFCEAQINHHCDNRKCVNPEHLYAGTQKDNARDREERGRGRRLFGSDHPNSKLTESQVREILRDYRFRKVTTVMLAKKYGVSDRTVSQVTRRERWAHI